MARPGPLPAGLYMNLLGVAAKLPYQLHFPSWAGKDHQRSLSPSRG